MTKVYFIFLFLSPTLISLEEFGTPHFVVWNVGQGQWTTLIEGSNCYHFDIGGEFFPFSKIEKTCRAKKNQLYLSHFDWDHLNGLKKVIHWENFCLMDAPSQKSDKQKNQLVQKISKCTESIPPFIQKIFNGQSNHKSNAQSQVFTASSILLSGDSLEEQEKTWSNRLKEPIHGFILGHHGSQSSNSDLLIQKIRHASWAVASSRWKRYHHPHPVIRERLKKFKIPLLLTEDWGNLIFQLSPIKHEGHSPSVKFEKTKQGDKVDTPYEDPELQAHNKQPHYKH